MKGKQKKGLKKKLSTIDEDDENSAEEETKTYEVNDSDEDGGAER